MTYELLECLRSEQAAGIHAAWRRAGLFPRAFPDLPLDTDESVRVLTMVDEHIAAGRKFADASLLGAFFLPRFLGLAEEETDANGRVNNAQLLARLREILDPAAASMHLSNLTIHQLHQGLFTLTKMKRPPERARQVLKLARQDYFQVAWDLHGFAEALGFIKPEAHKGWARALTRLKGDEPVVPAKEEQPKRRRPRLRRRRRGTS